MQTLTSTIVSPPIIQTPWLITLDQKDVKNLSFKHCHKSFCLDISGSTQTVLHSLSTVEVEKKFCRALNHGPTSVIGWDSYARVCNNLDDYRLIPTGGTEPACIFLDPTASAEIRKSSVLTLLTDGQIDAYSVASMAQQIQKFNHLGLNICVLVCPKTPTPGTLNVSVFASLLTGNTLILFYDGSSDPVVLGASGFLTQTVPYLEITEETKWDQLPTLPFETLTSLTVPQLKTAPEGYTSIGDCRYVNLTTLLNTRLDLPELNTLPVTQLISIAKTQGKLPELRNYLHSYEKLVADEEDGMLRDLPNSASKKAQQLAQAIMHSSEEEKVKLRAEYKTVRQEADLERINFQKTIKEKTRGKRAMIQTAMQAIQEEEKAGYDMASMSRSNRAMRAQDVKQVTDEDLENLDYTDAHQGECSICLEYKPLALLLRQHPKPEDNTSDWCLNFPLGHGYNNISVISPDVICVNCAQHFKNNGYDSTRVEVKGIYPGVKLSIDRNRNFCYRTLAHCLALDKRLPHLNMLFFATLDASKQKEWTKENSALLNYIQAQILQNCQTTKNMTAIGDKVNLATAMSEVLNCEEFMRQPMSACFLIMRTLIDFNLTLPLAGQSILHKLATQRFMRQMIETHLMNLKNNTVNYDLTRELFCTDYGVPIENTAKLTHYLDSKCLAQVLGPDNTKMFTDQTARFCRTLNIKPSDFMTAETYTVLLFTLYNTTHYDRVENTMNELFKNKLFYNAFKEPTTTQKDDVLKTMNETLFGRFFPENKEHSSTPPFVTVHGPSVFVCVCGKNFCEKLIDQKTTVKDLTEHIRKERAQHFVKAYNGANPSPQTSHYSLHRMISEEMQANPTKTVDRKTVLNVLKSVYLTKGNYGNIYQRRIIMDVIEAIHSYLLLADKNHDKETHVPLEKRVTMELTLLKVPIGDSITIPSSVKSLMYPTIPSLDEKTIKTLTQPLDEAEYNYVNGR